jgi:hypothetical protein
MFHNPTGMLIYLVLTLRVGTNRNDALRQRTDAEWRWDADE